MIPYFILGEETVMRAGPGLTVTLLCIAAYAIYRNMRARKGSRSTNNEKRQK